MRGGSTVAHGRFFVGAAAVAASCAALGHHSPAAYDLTQEVLIEGTVAEVAWANPHIYLTIETKGADGASLLQEVEAGPLAALQTFGLTRDHLAEGARVTVRGRPNRRGPGRTLLGIDLTTADGVIHRLRADGRTSEPRPVAAVADGIAGKWAPNVDDFAAFMRRGRTELQAALSDAGRAAQAAAQGPIAFNRDCMPPPVPQLAIPPYLRAIEIGEDEVVMRFDAAGVDTPRTVRLGVAAHPEGVEPSVQGHSIGWWEGETLVIDTVAFAPHHAGLLFGVPSGADKHVVERLTLTEDRRQLRYEITVEDPLYLSRPLVVRALWDHRPDIQPSEVACDAETAQRFLEE